MKIDYNFTNRFHTDEMFHKKWTVNMEYYIISLNPLPDDKIWDWSKLKQIADDILKYI